MGFDVDGFGPHQCCLGFEMSTVKRTRLDMLRWLPVEFPLFRARCLGRNSLKSSKSTCLLLKTAILGLAGAFNQCHTYGVEIIISIGWMVNTTLQSETANSGVSKDRVPQNPLGNIGYSCMFPKDWQFQQLWAPFADTPKACIKLVV